MTGSDLIAEERYRQRTVEGWSAEHDRDEHVNHELINAAICYARCALHGNLRERDDWPWEPYWWKPSEDPIRNLVKAGALIAAEIDRLQGTRPRAAAGNKCGGISRGTE